MPLGMQAHIDKIWRGEYDLPVESVQSVLDIGANIGGFSVWAAARWPSAGIFCVEPHPDNYRLLEMNTKHLPQVGGHRAAVALREGTVTLYLGVHNCGEHSLRQIGEQGNDFIMVRAIAASCLPPAEIIKVDTEGMEVEILACYKHWTSVRGVALEWHRPRDRDLLAAMLESRGLTIIENSIWAAERGNIRAVRK